MADASNRLIPRLAHLVSRFFDVLLARPLAPVEQSRVASLLRPAEAALFWEQPVADQRHGLVASDRVLSSEPERPDLRRAALLHDVGKRRSRLGAFGRSAASLAGILHIPVSRRFRTYLDHGPVGAEDLRAAGAETLAVEFAAAHHGVRPTAINPSDWRTLIDADS